MEDVIQEPSEAASTPSGRDKASEVFVTIGLILAPIAGVLMILTLSQAIYEIHHLASLPSYPAHADGISNTRRVGTMLFYVAGALVGPVAAALLWFDWIGAKIDRRSRLALIGFLGGMITLMALVFYYLLGNYPLR